MYRGLTYRQLVIRMFVAVPAVLFSAVVLDKVEDIVFWARGSCDKIERWALEQ